MPLSDEYASKLFFYSLPLIKLLKYLDPTFSEERAWSVNGKRIFPLKPYFDMFTITTVVIVSILL